MKNLSPLEQLAHRPALGRDDDELLGIASSEGSIRVVSGSGFRYVVPFPYRLHKMLSDVEARGDVSIVSFMPDGIHFKVHNPQRFVDEIIPKAFKQKSLKSFQRQLHLYGFQRAQDGPNKGAYWHESFVKDNRDMCLTISRIKAPKRRMSSHNSKMGVKKTPIKEVLTTSPPQTMFDSDFASCSHRTQPVHMTAPSGSVSPQQLSSATSSLGSSSGAHKQEGSEVETYQWLLNAGVPFSAFDPVALSDRNSSTKISSSELLECADEITSLFAMPSTPVSSSCHSMPPATATPSLNASDHLLSSFQNAYTSSVPNDTTVDDNPLPVSPSIDSSEEQIHLPDFLLGDGSLSNDNWALW
ncbi:HSF-type DNA-binding protein [Nitzschia inconspicua]|uniref:HSF-type DNA-binding protein n=1 Tax=Nitzschia inconspicua TaxID=303405 RepID=A0A9K3PMH2_9STRA|nr:HSF-type DNA-binding protein [Nitzschia inconspicua]